MEDREKIFVAVAFAGIAAVGIGFIRSIPNVRIEMEKRKKIQEWTLMNQEALKSVKTTWEEVSNDPDATAADLMKAFHEGNQFLNLINDQPMY